MCLDIDWYIADERTFFTWKVFQVKRFFVRTESEVRYASPVSCVERWSIVSAGLSSASKMADTMQTMLSRLQRPRCKERWRYSRFDAQSIGDGASTVCIYSWCVCIQNRNTFALTQAQFICSAQSEKPTGRNWTSTSNLSAVHNEREIRKRT